MALADDQTEVIELGMVVRSDTHPGTTAAVKAQLTAIVNSIQIEP